MQSDSSTLQPVDSLTPATICIRGAVVSAGIQKRQARGRLVVRIPREGCYPTLGPCVELDGILFRTVALSSTVAAAGGASADAWAPLEGRVVSGGIWYSF